jgi:hypothetical protein
MKNSKIQKNPSVPTSPQPPAHRIIRPLVQLVLTVDVQKIKIKNPKLKNSKIKKT